MTFKTTRVCWADFQGVDLSNPRKPRFYFLINGQHELAGERVGIQIIKELRIRIVWGSDTLRLLEDGIFHLDEIVSNGKNGRTNGTR